MSGRHAQETTIRDEQPRDAQAIHHVNARAFGQPAEADLVDLLRANGQALISLVAERDRTIVGHILFSPVVIGDDASFRALGLAPMAVLPEHQRSGAGSALVRAGLARARELGYQAIVVLGHAEYYPRFGFRRASELGLHCQFECPDEAFMALELEPGALRGRRGLARYRPELDGF